jgi:hypothetical protein
MEIATLEDIGRKNKKSKITRGEDSHKKKMKIDKCQSNLKKRLLPRTRKKRWQNFRLMQLKNMNRKKI